MAEAVDPRDVVRAGTMRRYVDVVGLLGALLLVQAVRGLDLSDLTQPGAGFWLVCGLLLMGELRPVLTGGSDKDGLVVTTAFVFAVLLGHGVIAALLLQALATTVVDLAKRKALWRIWFNVGQYTLSWSAAALVMRLLGHQASLAEPLSLGHRDLAVALAGGATYFCVNQVLASYAIALRAQEPFRDVLFEDVRYEVSTNATLLALAPLVALAVERGVLFVPLLLPPLLAVYQVAGIARLREEQSLTDALTGLPNRTRLRQRTAEALAGQERTALVLFDLDRFKEVNDTLGHHVGDALLRVVSQRLSDAVRPCDTVARLGGDEFALVLPGVRDVAGALQTAERLRAVLTEAVLLEGLLVDVGASVGVAVSPEDGTTLDDLLQHADVAMYVAKESGTGVEAYAAERDLNTTGRLVVLGELRRAIAEDELELHFQPKADLRLGRVVGVEALVRWRHPERGLIPPDDFVPLAERTGLVQLLTTWVLDAALAQAAVWRAEGLDLDVAVNVSVKDLCSGGLADRVAAALDRHGVPASRLQLEVTEGTLFADPARATATLHGLRALGVTLSLDDFGTGWSSLNHLRRLPVSEVKIDRSFVMRMEDDPRDLAIVRSVIDLGLGLGLRVVAEGVETEAAWQRLAALGCDTAQGWFLSKAQPADVLTPWLHAHRAEQTDSAALPQG
ncbi:MAG: diguanylate cyclase/phosphodiesterase [Frankiales bacterium]|nr:diguanylate cyclase/phosphodiesterase [Frankiales bacterium]